MNPVIKAVRCKVCGLFVRPGTHYGNLRVAIPGWHYPCLSEETLTAVEADHYSTMTLCEGSQEPGSVYTRGDE